MTVELNELKQHVRWLEDEVSRADEIDNRLQAIEAALTRLADAVYDVLGGFMPTEPNPAAKPSPRKPKLMMVPRTIISDDGPGAAS